MQRGAGGSTSVTVTPMRATWAASSTARPSAPMSKFEGSSVTRSPIGRPGSPREWHFVKQSSALRVFSRLERRLFYGPTPAARRVAELPAEHRNERPARPLLGPHRYRMGSRHLRVDDGKAPARDALGQPDEGHLRRVRLPGEHRLSEEHAAERDAVEPPGELAFEPGLDGVRVAHSV